MKAWVVREKGNPWDVVELAEFPEPTHAAPRDDTVDLAGLRRRGSDEPPPDDDVILRVHAAALTTPGITMATGEYPVPIERPCVSGQEAIGIVEEAAEGLQPRVGRRAVGFTPQPWGCAAERCVVLGSTLYEAPPSMSDDEAATHRHLLQLVGRDRDAPQVGRIIDFESMPEGLPELARRDARDRSIARVA